MPVLVQVKNDKATTKEIEIGCGDTFPELSIKGKGGYVEIYPCLAVEVSKYGAGSSLERIDEAVVTGKTVTLERGAMRGIMLEEAPGGYQTRGISEVRIAELQPKALFLESGKGKKRSEIFQYHHGKFIETQRLLDELESEFDSFTKLLGSLTQLSQRDKERPDATIPPTVLRALPGNTKNEVTSGKIGPVAFQKRDAKGNVVGSFGGKREAIPSSEIWIPENEEDATKMISIASSLQSKLATLEALIASLDSYEAKPIPLDRIAPIPLNLTIEEDKAEDSDAWETQAFEVEGFWVEVLNVEGEIQLIIFRSKEDWEKNPATNQGVYKISSEVMSEESPQVAAVRIVSNLRLAEVVTTSTVTEFSLDLEWKKVGDREEAIAEIPVGAIWLDPEYQQRSKGPGADSFSVAEIARIWAKTKKIDDADYSLSELCDRMANSQEPKTILPFSHKPDDSTIEIEEWLVPLISKSGLGENNTVVESNAFGIDESRIIQYSSMWNQGLVPPEPIEIWAVEGKFILTHGYHRLFSLMGSGGRTIQARIVKGSRNEAFRASCMADTKTPLPRSETAIKYARRNFITATLINPLISFPQEWDYETTFAALLKGRNQIANVTKLAIEIGCDRKTLTYDCDLIASQALATVAKLGQWGIVTEELASNKHHFKISDVALIGKVGQVIGIDKKPQGFDRSLLTGYLIVDFGNKVDAIWAHHFAPAEAPAKLPEKKVVESSDSTTATTTAQTGKTAATQSTAAAVTAGKTATATTEAVTEKAATSVATTAIAPHREVLVKPESTVELVGEALKLVSSSTENVGIDDISTISLFLKNGTEIKIAID